MLRGKKKHTSKKERIGECKDQDASESDMDGRSTVKFTRHSTQDQTVGDSFNDSGNISQDVSDAEVGDRSTGKFNRQRTQGQTDVGSYVVNGNGILTAASVPGDDYEWLKLSLKENHLKVHSLMFATENPTTVQEEMVNDLIRFLVETLGYETFGEVGAIIGTSFDLIEGEMNNGRYSISEGTWTFFAQFCEVMKEIVDAKKAAEKRSAGIPATVTPAGTNPAIFLGMVNNYVEQWWEQHGKQIDPSTIKLEEFEFPESMKNFVTGKIPVMQAPDSENGRPKLLLSNLTDNNNCDLEKSIFDTSSKFICAMFGVSGIGKTRRIFEMLCDNFGFYFLAGFTTEVGDTRAANPASKDFATALTAAHDSCTRIDGDDQDAGRRRLGIIMKFTSLVVFTRALILNFLKMKWRGLSPKQWLLIQLYPKKYLGMQLFTNTFNYAYSRDGEQHALDVRIGILEEVAGWNKRPLLVFMDEAQVYRGSLHNKFPSATNKVKLNRDLLSAIGKAFQSMIGSLLRGAVLTGTGSRMLDPKESIYGGVVKDGETKQTLFYDMFPLNEVKVKEYMSLYVDITQLDGDVVTHCAKWLVGRPRWTAAFLQEWFVRRRAVDKQTPGLAAMMLPDNDALMHRYYNADEWEKLKKDSPESAWMLVCCSDFIQNMVSAHSSGRDSGYVDTARSLVNRFLSKRDERADMIQLFGMAVLRYSCRGGQVMEVKSLADTPAALYVEFGLCVFSRESTTKGVQDRVSNSNRFRDQALRETNDRVQLAEPLIVEAAVREYGWMFLVEQAMTEIKNQHDKAAAGKVFGYCVIPILEALFVGEEIEGHAALGGSEITNDFKGQWRTPLSAYGVYLDVNDNDKDQFKTYLEQLKTSTIEGQVPGWSLTDNLVDADVVGQVVADDKKRGLKRRMVLTQVNLQSQLTSEEDHGAHLTTIPMRQSNKSVVPSNRAPRDEVIKLIRTYGGVFRCILKYPAKKNNPDRIQPGMKDVDSPGAKMQDCLLVVDGETGLQDMLSSSFGGPSNGSLHKLVNQVYRLPTNAKMN